MVPIEDRAVFTVIGAGVIGLLTAQALAERGHDVTVVSKEGSPSRETGSTSSIAIGQFLPWVPEDHQEVLLGDLSLEEVTDYSRNFYSELANNPHVTGVMELSNVELVSSSSPWPSDLPRVMRATDEQLDEPIELIGPAGEAIAYDTALTFNTFSINTRKTIGYLAERAKELGVKFEKREVTREELERLEGVIVNATGMGAAPLDPASLVKEFKGHTFVVRPKEGYFVPREALSVEDIIMMPREDGTAVCGALYLENPARPVPEAVEADELFARLRETFQKTADMVDGLEPDLLDNVDVVVHSAGYRVEVEGSGIRVAPDEDNERLLHAYGFGGLGWSVGPHFAQKIATIAHTLHQQTK